MPVPTEYPSQHHARFAELVTAFAAGGQTPADHVVEFCAALEALVHRYRACRESARVFVASTGDAYAQDRDYFAFTLNGSAAIGTLCYGAYAAGAMFWPHLFPFGSEAARRAVGPRSTARAYDLAGQTEFAALLNGLLNSAEYRRWDDNRNSVTHRGKPDDVGTPEEALQWLTGALTQTLAGLVRVAESERQ